MSVSLKDSFWVAVMPALLLFAFAIPVNSAVPEARLERLARGVNVPHWFWAAPNLSKQHIETYFTKSDVNLIVSTGLTHVRLPVEISFIADWEMGGPLKEDNLELLDRAVKMLIESGLAVTVCPFGDFQDKIILPGMLPYGVRFWESFALHLSQFDSEMLFIEVANEPAGTPAQWEPVQRVLLEAIRKGAPEHTLITATTLKSGKEDDPWHTADALAEMSPVDDKNVVYNFHFYEPFWFTHQGATWAGPGPKVLRRVPYPSNPENVADLVEKLKTEVMDAEISWISSVIREYGEQRWNAQKIEAQLKPAIDWAAKHKVPLMVNEFGVYRQYSAERDRLAWIRDVRTILEKHKVAWAMWDYSGGFSLAKGDAGSREIDAATLQALKGSASRD